MSRTRRNYPTWVDWIDNYDERLKRDNHGYPIQAYNGIRYEEVWGRRRKKKEKKLRSRLRRLQDKEIIKREIKEAA